MKIAVLTPGYAPDPGGVEAVVTAVCAGLVARGAMVEVWTHGRKPAVEMLDGVQVRRFRTTRSHRFPLSPALWRHARSRASEFDLLHAHSFHSTAAFGALTAGTRAPMIFTPHYHGGGHTPLARLLHVPYRPVGRLLFGRSAAVVAVSQAERDAIARDQPRALDRLHVIHNAVDVAVLHAAQPRPDEPPTVLVLGRLERYKRVDLVLSAFEQASVAGQLVVLGDGPDRPRLEQLAAANRRAAEIRILGRVDRDEVDRWLRTARVVVSMSDHEAFGIVGLEAVAAGAQALLSPLPAHDEVVELAGKEHARIVTPAGLVHDLETALARPAGTPRTVRDWSAVVDEHLTLYESVIR